MTELNKKIELETSTDTANAYSTCDAQPFDSVIHINFLDNTLPDKCANLIIADPPYFEVKGDFDFIWKSFDDYLKDVEKWAIECKRILADNGTLFWYGHAKNIAYAQIIFDKHFNLINNLVWDKGSFMGLEESEGLRSFAPCTERILMYSTDFDVDVRSDKNNFLPIKQYMRDERKKCGLSASKLKEKTGLPCNLKSIGMYFGDVQWQLPTKENYEMMQTTGYWQKSYKELRKEYEELRRPFVNLFKLQEILRFSNEASKTGAKYDHDTVKPETLTRALILTCSRPNDLVVVPFAGSGTEMAMSIKEGRKAIGYDIEKKYVDMSNKRIKTFKDAPSLF
jgi:DNA modification methylase